jgi:ribonuclease Z
MLSVTFLGTAAACPTVERNVSGLAVKREGETILFDCGEGTQRQMMRYGVGFTFRRFSSPTTTPTTSSVSPG